MHDQILTLKIRGRKICLLNLSITSLFSKPNIALHSPLPSFLLDLLTGSSYRNASPYDAWGLCSMAALKEGQHVLSPPMLLARLKTLTIPKMIEWPSRFVWSSHPYHYLPPQSLLSTDFICQEQGFWTQCWELRLPTSNPSSDNYTLCSLEQLLMSSCQGLLTCRMVAIAIFPAVFRVSESLQHLELKNNINKC